MRKTKNTRGIALESAIYFMLIVFSLCFLMYSVIMVSLAQEEKRSAKNEEGIKLEQEIEDALYRVCDSDPQNDCYSNDYVTCICTQTETDAESGYPIATYSITLKDKETYNYSYTVKVTYYDVVEENVTTRHIDNVDIIERTK